MPIRSVYLAKSRGVSSQRFHFGIFIPNNACDRSTLADDYRLYETLGTVLHVVGEPLMAGFVFEIKRNFDGQHDNELKQLVLLGKIDVANLHDSTSEIDVKEDIPRSVVERHAASVPPPPRGQNTRAPIDGVNTRRCQEWTMEVLTLLAQKHLIPEDAVRIAEEERDPPTHGIFGYNNQHS
ncbi:hypothetical protein FDECE_2494 [Fusarium decemcellulare]|nr:hypothetical protein FDECE_2494 [Fusarium decemcellulare]